MLLRRPLAVFGRVWSLLVASSGALERTGGALGALLGAFGALLELLWDLLRASESRNRCFPAAKSNIPKCALGAVLERSWASWSLLVRSLGALGRSWSALGRSLGGLGRSWCALWSLLVALGALLGPSWSHHDENDGTSEEK